MRRLLQSLAVAASVGLPGSALAADCGKDALAQLRASAPDGYAIYQQMADPAFFKGWIRCDDAQFDLPTAVHESVHRVTTDTDAFPLIGGGSVALPHEVSAFFPPTRIAGRFKPDDFTTIYLRLGKASSSTDFLYMLDELDAYSHDLQAAIDLKDLASSDVSIDHRDGLAALMAFVATYAEVAREREPRTWDGLRKPQVARAITTLWGQAERVMAASCGIPNYGTLDKAYIGRFCAAKAQAALAPILGRAPVCPTACLASDTADASGMEGRDEATARRSSLRRSTAGPYWLTAIIRSKAASGEGAGANE